MSQGIGVRRTNYTVDTQTELAPSAAVTATGNGPNIVDLGGGGQANAPFVMFDWHVNVSAIDVASTDEIYTIRLEGSNSASFASGIEELASMTLSAAAAAPGNGDVGSDAGRYTVTGSNERNGRTYRYVRLHNTVAGTTPSITYQSDLGKKI